MCAKDLFGVQASLEEMEEQAAAVKKVVSEIVKQMNSEDLDRSVKQLMHQEQQHRARIENLYKSNRVSEVHLIEYWHALVSLVDVFSMCTYECCAA